MYSTGLPRNDVPLDLVRFTPGHLGRVKQRAQIGFSNRRENFSADVVPTLQQLQNTSTRLAPMMNASLERSKSALDVTGASRLDVTNEANSSTIKAPCEELLGSLHYRAQRSFTPESYFFDSQLAGSGGQLIEDRKLVLRSHSQLSLRSGHSHVYVAPGVRKGGSPVPLPVHQKTLSKLREAASLDQSRNSPSPALGVAGVLPSPCADDSSGRELARTTRCESKQNSHLSYTPIENGFIATGRNSSCELSSSRMDLKKDRTDVYSVQQKHFFVSTPGTEDPQRASTIPHVSNPKPKLRQELTDYHSTHYVTQPPTDAGQYCGEQARFVNANRGLGSSLLGQQERAAANTIQDIRALRRQMAEERVIQSCHQRDAVAVNRKENQIETMRAVNLAAWKIERQRKDAQLREQAELDAQSDAFSKKHNSSHGH